MSKPTSTARLVPCMIVGVFIICGCFALGAAFFFINNQLSARMKSSIPLSQPPVLPQISEPTQRAVPPTQGGAPEQPAQYALGYSDFLGKNQYDANFLDMSQTHCGLGQYDWVCPTLGIEFSDSQGDNIIDEVWIYPAGYANFDEYKGEMPYGLVWGDTYSDVVNKIGQSDSFLNYGWVYTNLGISIHYQTDAPSMPNPAETIQYILVFLP